MLSKLPRNPFVQRCSVVYYARSLEKLNGLTANPIITEKLSKKEKKGSF